MTKAMMSTAPSGSRTGPFMVVRNADPAVDGNAETDWVAYYADRDPKRLTYLPGMTPVEYWCRPLSMAERREVRARRDANGESTSASREHAFRLGLVRVLRLKYADGGTRDWHRPDDKSGVSRPIPDDAMEPFGDVTIEEVGAIIEARSFLDHDQPLVCPLLGTSQRALSHLLHHRAEQTKGSSSSARSKPEAAATATTPDAAATSSPAGDAPGDATATASPTSAPAQ